MKALAKVLEEGMSRISRRTIALYLSSTMVGAVLTPTRTFAQSNLVVQGQDTLGHGDGTAADAATTSKIEGLTHELIKAINAKDGNAAVQLVTVQNGLESFLYGATPDAAAQVVASGGITPCTLLTLGDVRTHSDGFASIVVTFTGFWPADAPPQVVATNRWYLAPNENGGYLFDNGVALVPVIPKEMTSTGTGLSLSNQGLKLDHRNFPKVDVLLLTATNQELGNNWVTTGIYELPQGMHSGDAQNQIIQSMSAGNGIPDAFKYVAKTPMSPAKQYWTWGVLVKPGTYFIQQFSLDADGNNPQPLAGSQYVTSFLVA